MSISQNNLTVSDIYRSRNNLLNILEKRGYDINDYTGFTFHEVQCMLNEKCLDMLLENQKMDKKIYVKYHLHQKLRPNSVYDYIDELYTATNTLTKKDELIIIVKEKLNDTQYKKIKEIWNVEGIYFNICNLKNHLHNILEHTLVPPHKVLSDEEMEKIKIKYNITYNSQFPEISRFDPVAIAIGLRPHQLCEITRSSPTSIKSKYYRFCN